MKVITFLPGKFSPQPPTLAQPTRQSPRYRTLITTQAKIPQDTIITTQATQTSHTNQCQRQSVLQRRPSPALWT